MTTEPIIESGMTFGPYPAGQCFHIEKSRCYKKIQEGVKMAEFLLLRQQEKGSTLWVVEAKSSCPREFTAYMDDIRTKLVNAFMLGIAACMDRHPAANDELPQTFKDLNLRSASFRFVLIIGQTVPQENLAVLQDALKVALRSVTKTWALAPTSVIVLDQQGAQQHGLILPATGATP